VLEPNRRGKRPNRFKAVDHFYYYWKEPGHQEQQKQNLSQETTFWVRDLSEWGENGRHALLKRRSPKRKEGWNVSKRRQENTSYSQKPKIKWGIGSKRATREGSVAGAAKEVGSKSAKTVSGGHEPERLNSRGRGGHQYKKRKEAHPKNVDKKT